MPNTISQLNDFADQAVEFEDERAFAITFSANTASNQTVSVVEDAVHTVPVGINIVDVVSQPANANITYNLDFSGTDYSNLVLTYASLPAGVSFANGAPGVFSVTGFMTASTWDIIKAPQALIKDLDTSFSYLANLQYPSIANTANIDTWSYTVNVSVTSGSDELSIPAGLTYDEDVAFAVNPFPQIIDAYVGPESYSITVTPNTVNAVQTISSTGPANSSYNLPLRQLTISGTKANVNVNLGNIQIQPYPDYELDFQIDYSLTNPISNLITQVSQAANIGNVNVELTVPTGFVYDEDITMIVPTPPQIDDAYPHTNWNLTVVPNIASSITSLSSAGTANSTYFAGNATLVLTGNSTAINQNLGNITLVPAPDFDQSFLLTYTLTNPVTATQTQRTQLATIGNINTEVSNVGNITRFYYTNGADLLLANAVIPEVVANAVYNVTIQLSSNTGIVSLGDNLNNPFDFNAANLTFFTSGNRSFINDTIFPQLRYFPHLGNTANVTATYVQSRGGSSTTETFDIESLGAGNAFANIPSLTGTYAEDQTANILTFAGMGGFFPGNVGHWSEPFSVEIRSRIAGVDVGNVFTYDTQGTGSLALANIGNSTVLQGIYYNFVPALNYFNLQQRQEMYGTEMFWQVRPDQDNTFTMAFSSSNTAHNGTAFAGSVIDSANIVFTCSNVNPDFEITTTTYQQDQIGNIDYAILDGDVTATNYTLTFAHDSVPQGQYLLNGNAAGFGNSITFSDTKANINANAYVVAYQPYPSETGNVDLLFSMSKTNYLGNVDVVSNVGFGLSCSNTHPNYSVDYPPNTRSFLDVNDTQQMGGVIVDTDEIYDSYRMRIIQTSPVPSTLENSLYLRFGFGANTVLDPLGTGYGDTDWVIGNRRDFNTSGPPLYNTYATFYANGVLEFGTPEATASMTIPPTFLGNGTLDMSVEKITEVGNIAILSNHIVSFSATDSNYPSGYVSHTLTNTGTFSNVANTFLNFAITTHDDIIAERTVDIIQLDPDPAVYTPTWRDPNSFPVTYIQAANVSEIQFSANDINPTVGPGGIKWEYTANTAYTGNTITLGFNYRYTITSGAWSGNTLVFASNVPITLTRV